MKYDVGRLVGTQSLSYKNYSDAYAGVAQW